VANADVGCCWTAALNSAAAVCIAVLKVTALRCTPEPEIDVAKANMMARAAVETIVRVTRISMSVSPSSERSRRRSRRWAGVGPLANGNRRRRFTGG
jgi:hypothetical protein